MLAKFRPEKYDFGLAYTKNFHQKKKKKIKIHQISKEKISKSPDFL
jgi:hypothetical protein